MISFVRLIPIFNLVMSTVLNKSCFVAVAEVALPFEASDFGKTWMTWTVSLLGLISCCRTDANVLHWVFWLGVTFMFCGLASEDSWAWKLKEALGLAELSI